MTNNLVTQGLVNELAKDAQGTISASVQTFHETADRDREPANMVSSPTTAATAESTPTSAPTGAEEGGEGGKQAPALPASPPSPGLAAASVGTGPSEPLGDDIYQPAPGTNPVVDALIEAGHYLHPVGSGEHRITCPFSGEHRSGEPTEASYFEPSDAVPLGTFYCCSHHSKQRRIGALLDELKVDRTAARCKPLIRIRLGELHRVVAAAEKVLVRRGGFYRFNGLIATIKTDPHTGDISMEPATDQSLTLQLSAACDMQKWDARSEEWRRCDVPSNVVAALMKSQAVGELPVLNALARQPYLRAGDGKLVTTPGYDPASGVCAMFDPEAFSLPLLTRENALKALHRLQGLLTEFEFEGPKDRASTISAMLTATVRDYLPLAPGFNITASSPGSGKSYLASVIAPFAGPGDMRSISYPGTSEEATKVVLSLALEQPAVVCFDDMSSDWLPWGAMNRMLTSGSITERVLGSSKVVTARASSFVMGTGNNIRPLRDMARRVVSIYLLPKVENAATRSFSGRPAEEVRQHRGQYVSDALTIIAAWRAAGSPKADVPNVAGFEQWSDLCRHSLIWLGEPDAAYSLIEQQAHDPDREVLGTLLHAWHESFGTKATMVRQVIKHISNHDQGDLHAAMMDLPCVDRGQVNQSRFGRYLARNKNRIVNGFKLLEAPLTERKAWGVVKVSEEPPVARPVTPDDPLEGIERTWPDLKIEQQAERTTSRVVA